MVDTLSDINQIARNSYPCDACEIWLNTGYDESDVSADDWLIIEGARADKWKIRKGTKYRKVVSVDNGLFSTYRARIDMDALCSRLDLYGD
jgi:hypothetical protein